MLSSTEIRNVKFSKSVGGYKQEEVDILLDKIEVDYERFEKAIAQREARIAELENEINSMETSKESIQTVLLSAQKLADQIVADAKEKSAQILKEAEGNIELISARERELSGEFDRRANERKAKFDEEMLAANKLANEKLVSVQRATEEAVNRQQILFNKIKMEIAAFKTDITNRYREHLEILQKLPDTILDDPQSVAAAIDEIYSKKVVPEEYILKTETAEEETEEVLENEVEEIEVLKEEKSQIDIVLDETEDLGEDY